MNVSNLRTSTFSKSASTRLSNQPPTNDADHASTPSVPKATSGTLLKLLDTQSRQQHSALLDSATREAAPLSREIDSLVAAFSERFAATAQDPEAFRVLLGESFGDSHDQQAGEALRQRSLAGDFAWIPRVEVVDASVLTDQSGTQGEGSGMGAYDAANDRILLSEELFNSGSGKALDVLTEEIGHGLDARLNSSDTAGDEGAVFALLSSGTTLAAADLAALRTEDDSGTINVNGEEVEVEFWFGNDLVDGVKDTFNDATDFITDGVESIGGAINDGVHWVGDVLGDSVDSVYENLLQPVLDNAGVVGEFIDSHLVRPVVDLANNSIDIAINVIESIVDTGTHFLGNSVQTFGHLLQGDLSGAWSSFVQTGTDLFSDTTSAFVETFFLGLHAATSLTKGVLGLSRPAL